MMAPYEELTSHTVPFCNTYILLLQLTSHQMSHLDPEKTIT